MANRTIQFYGYAYGNTPVQLNAHINGEVVFSGAVSTVDTPTPSDQINMGPAPVLFSVENSPLFPVEFSGSYPMTLSVATGYSVALSQILCNYMQAGNVAGNAATFLNCYDQLDPRTNVAIDGVDQNPVRDSGYTGPWTWQVPQGSTISCNLNVSLGNVAA